MDNALRTNVTITSGCHLAIPDHINREPTLVNILKEQQVGVLGDCLAVVFVIGLQ